MREREREREREILGRGYGDDFHWFNFVLVCLFIYKSDITVPWAIDVT